MSTSAEPMRKTPSFSLVLLADEVIGRITDFINIRCLLRLRFTGDRNLWRKLSLRSGATSFEFVEPVFNPRALTFITQFSGLRSLHIASGPFVRSVKDALMVNELPSTLQYLTFDFEGADSMFLRPFPDVPALPAFSFLLESYQLMPICMKDKFPNLLSLETYSAWSGDSVDFPFLSGSTLGSHDYWNNYSISYFLHNLPESLTTLRTRLLQRTKMQVLPIGHLTSLTRLSCGNETFAGAPPTTSIPVYIRANLLQLEWPMLSKSELNYSQEIMPAALPVERITSRSCLFPNLTGLYTGGSTSMHVEAATATMPNLQALRCRTGCFAAGIHWTDNMLAKTLTFLDMDLSHVKNSLSRIQRKDFLPPSLRVLIFATNDTLDSFDCAVLPTTLTTFHLSARFDKASIFVNSSNSDVIWPPGLTNLLFRCSSVEMFTSGVRFALPQTLRTLALHGIRLMHRDRLPPALIAFRMTPVVPASVSTATNGYQVVLELSAFRHLASLVISEYELNSHDLHLLPASLECLMVARILFTGMPRDLPFQELNAATICDYVQSLIPSKLDRRVAWETRPFEHPSRGQLSLPLRWAVSPHATILPSSLTSVKIDGIENFDLQSIPELLIALSNPVDYPKLRVLRTRKRCQRLPPLVHSVEIVGDGYVGFLDQASPSMLASLVRVKMPDTFWHVDIYPPNVEYFSVRRVQSIEAMSHLSRLLTLKLAQCRYHLIKTLPPSLTKLCLGDTWSVESFEILPPGLKILKLRVASITDVRLSLIPQSIEKFFVTHLIITNMEEYFPYANVESPTEVNFEGFILEPFAAFLARHQPRISFQKVILPQVLPEHLQFLPEGIKYLTIPSNSTAETLLQRLPRFTALVSLDLLPLGKQFEYPCPNLTMTSLTRLRISGELIKDNLASLPKSIVNLHLAFLRSFSIKQAKTLPAGLERLVLHCQQDSSGVIKHLPRNLKVLVIRGFVPNPQVISHLPRTLKELYLTRFPNGFFVPHLPNTLKVLRPTQPRSSFALPSTHPLF